MLRIYLIACNDTFNVRIFFKLAVTSIPEPDVNRNYKASYKKEDRSDDPLVLKAKRIHKFFLL